MYNSILNKMNTSPTKTLFVAGSPFDVIGAKSMGMDVYWHNRIGLDNTTKQEPDYNEKTLYKLIEILNL
jgi:FMN phosphatase YigB (HAD superfamily)